MSEEGREGAAGRSGWVRRSIDMELAGWRGLFRWVLRRPNIPAGSDAFGYVAPVRTVLIVFIVLSAVEIPIFDLILAPWPVARIVAVVLGVWGLTFMLGLLASFIVNPHTVGEDGLRIRSGAALDIAIPWGAVEAVEYRFRGLASSKSVQPERSGDEVVLKLPMTGETNVEVKLSRPIVVRVKSRDETITAVHCHADDARALVAAARERRLREGVAARSE